VRLIRITRNCGQVCERPAGTWSACEIQKALKTQHRLKYLRTITNGSREPPLKLPVADSDPLTELLNSAMRVSSKPSDTRHNHAVRLGSQRSGAGESLSER
jgi:hypothetical protein